MEQSMNYRILKIPVSKDKSVFYYYKPFNHKDFLDTTKNQSEQILSLPQNKCIYICHFLRDISEDFINKYFSKIGKIKQINLGKYKNKSTNGRKGKRKTIYFAIIVFKNQEDVQRIFDNPKLMQSVVNKISGKSVKGVEGLEGVFSDEEEEQNIQNHKESHKKQMEEGGFTLVTEGGNTMQSKKHKVADKYVTTMLGVSQEEADRVYRESLKRGQSIIGLSEEEARLERDRVFKEEHESEALKGLNLQDFYNVKKGTKSSMYGYQLKDKRKKELQDLRDNFEEYKKRLAKRLQKDENRQKALMKS